MSDLLESTGQKRTDDSCLTDGLWLDKGVCGTYDSMGWHGWERRWLNLSLSYGPD